MAKSSRRHDGLDQNPEQEQVLLNPVVSQQQVQEAIHSQGPLKMISPMTVEPVDPFDPMGGLRPKAPPYQDPEGVLPRLRSDVIPSQEMVAQTYPDDVEQQLKSLRTAKLNGETLSSPVGLPEKTALPSEAETLLPARLKLLLKRPGHVERLIAEFLGMLGMRRGRIPTPIWKSLVISCLRKAEAFTEQEELTILIRNLRHLSGNLWGEDKLASIVLGLILPEVILGELLEASPLAMAE